MATLDGGLMRQRPPASAAPDDTQLRQPDYSNPAPLGALKPFTASDGSTLRIHHIGDRPQAEATLPPNVTAVAATSAVHDAVEAAKFADPGRWYGCASQGDIDWPDDWSDIAPSQVGRFDTTGGRTPQELRIMRSGIPAVFGNSALTHQTAPADPWFRNELAAAEADRTLRTFHERWNLADGAPEALRHHPGSLHTAIFATVRHAEFTFPSPRSGATR